MNVIGWPLNVNQFISDQTSITIGEGGYVEDQVSTGHQERYLTQTVSQKRFNVVMFFDYVAKDSDGLSEYDRFEQWYEFRHKRGVVPFEFPSISKFNIDSTSNATYEYARYRITSPLQVSKSGLDMQVSMTWTEVYSGIQIIPDMPTPEFTAISADDNIVSLIFSNSLTENIVLSEFNFTISADGGVNYEDYTPSKSTVYGNQVKCYCRKVPSGTYIVKVVHDSKFAITYMEVR